MSPLASAFLLSFLPASGQESVELMPVQPHIYPTRSSWAQALLPGSVCPASIHTRRPVGEPEGASPASHVLDPPLIVQGCGPSTSPFPSLPGSPLAVLETAPFKTRSAFKRK